MAMESAGSPFDRLTLAQLRTRTSAKWRAFPPDVLPLWVAEMDTIVAEPIVEAVHRALAPATPAIPTGGLRRSDGGLRPERWDWEIDTGLVPAVYRCHDRPGRDAAAGHRPGDAVVVTPPVYPPFFTFLGHHDRGW